MYQKHTHSRTYRKYRNIQSTYAGLILVSFSQTRTIVAQPVSADDLCEEVKTGILSRRASYYSWHCEEQ